MDNVRVCLLLLVVLTLVTFNQCGRGGGGRSGGSFSRSPSRPSSVYRPPVHYPSPTARRPAPTHRPSPNYRPSPQPTYRPTTRSTYRLSTRPTHHYDAPTQRVVTPRPINTPRPGPTPPPARPGTTQRGFTTRRSTSGPISPSRISPSGSAPNRPYGWDLPPRPGSIPHGSHSGPQGPPKTNSYNTYSGYKGPSKVKVVNQYNYHYPGYYSLPVHSSYPGYYQAPTYYHYSTHDTGSTALGFFLGYGFARLTTPTYSHYRFYDGYTPRYDHYEVHHYYHNRDSVPPRQEIKANSIVGCVGDSQDVCPRNTTSLCTTEGALMCVVSATSTTPCTDNQQVNCVKSIIDCVNNTVKECQNRNTTSVNIPCVSTAKVYGDLKFVDKTIIVDLPANATLSSDNSSTTTPEYSTRYPITTTPTPGTSTNATIQISDKRPQEFCVTVIALPAKKKETRGEKLLEDANDIASDFIESVWGL